MIGDGDFSTGIHEFLRVRAIALLTINSSMNWKGFR
jgi:hypothetical protein